MTRYARAVGEFPLLVDDHAGALLDRVKTAARGASADRDAKTEIARALATAFAAGVREGRSATHAAMAATVADHVARAVASITVEPAQCPHCESRGCGACENTGRRR